MENPFHQPLNKRLDAFSKDWKPSDLSKERYDQIVEDINRRMAYRDLDIQKILVGFYEAIQKDFENLEQEDQELFVQLNDKLAKEQQEEE